MVFNWLKEYVGISINFFVEFEPIVYNYINFVSKMSWYLKAQLFITKR